MSKFKLGALCVLIAAASASVAAEAPCTGPANSIPAMAIGAPAALNNVIAQVRGAAPEVRQAALEMRASQADADQAGKRLNPSIGLQVENFSGSGSLARFDQTETTLSVAHTFQLGRKRNKREQAARAIAALRSAECSAILRETELEAALLFYDLQAEMKFISLAKESAALADSLTETVFKRVEVGAAAPPELSRTRADAATLRATVYAVQGRVDQKRYELSALWGSADPVVLAPDVEAKASGEGLYLISDRLNAHPDLTVATASAEARQAEHNLARAVSVPDLTISAGVRQFEGTGENAFLLGVSVPIPLFDRNRNAMRAAGYRTDASNVNRAAIEVRLLARQRSAVAQVRAARERLALLENEALPSARLAYDASVEGYGAGRFDLTTTLDAQKELIGVSAAVIDAARALSSEDMRLKSLIGVAPFDGEF